MDYVAFSPSAPNFLTDSLWPACQFTRDGLSAIAIDALPPDRRRELDALSWRYYWGPLEAMFERMDRREDVSYFSNFFPENCFDLPPLSLPGLEKPANDSRMTPAPYSPSRSEMP